MRLSHARVAVLVLLTSLCLATAVGCGTTQASVADPAAAAQTPESAPDSAPDGSTESPEVAPADSANASEFTVGTLHVQSYGEHGTPVILIPGLGSGAWVWTDTIKHLQGNHRVYAVTLAGFDGTPPPEQKTGLMAQTEESLLQLIQSRKLDRPVLVGHSIGGTLAIGFAEKHSDLIAGVVAVDGMPVFPGFENISPENLQKAAAGTQKLIATATQDEFLKQQVGYMQQMGVIDPEAAEKYGKRQARSDQATVAQYMFEDLTIDLRPDLDKINVPLLEVSPYNAPDFEAAAAHTHKPVMSEAKKTEYYRSLLDGAADLKVVSITPSRHFVMLDRPEAFHQTLDTFLARAHETSDSVKHSTSANDPSER